MSAELDPPLDAGGLIVFRDWLLERGFEPVTTDRVPWNMERKGKISTVRVYWFNNDPDARWHRPHEDMRVDILVEWETTRTRFRAPYDEWHQSAVPITWNSLVQAVGRALELQRRIEASASPRSWIVPAGMEKPPGLSSDGERAWKTLLDFFKKHGLTYTGGGTTFQSPEEWAVKERGGEMEHYADGAVLVVMYDGGEPRDAMNPDGGDEYGLHDKMVHELDKAGLAFHPWTGWAGGVVVR